MRSAVPRATTVYKPASPDDDAGLHARANAPPA
jgi:hypothetical protein